MAGSISDFVYLDDRNQPWIVRIDRSNALINGTGFVPLSLTDLGLNFLPRNIDLRYVICRHPTRPITRKIYCKSISSPIWIGSIFQISLRDFSDGSMQDFTIGSSRGERKSYSAQLTDTYQNT